MPTESQIIEIITKYRDETEGLQKTKKHLQDLQDEFEGAGSEVEDIFDKSIDKLGQFEEKYQKQTVKGVLQTAKTKEKSDKKGERQTRKSMKGMGDAAKALSITLPLMFGFQKVSEEIKSLLDPAMELVGVQSTYQQFLAIKYLPTALKQLDVVLAQGDAWEDQTEEQRALEGNMLLVAQQMSDFITYAAQMATTLGAIGEILPTINLAPLGVGIEITGREMGAAVGVAMALAGAVSLLGTEGGIAATSFSSFGAQVMLQGTDKMAGFLYQIGIANDTGLPKLGDNLDETKRKTGIFGDSVSALFQGLKDINNKGENWLVKILSGITGDKPAEIKKTLEELKKGPWNIPITITTSILGGMGWIWDTLKLLVKTVIGTTSSILGHGFPSFQTGGIMPYTGMAMLHAGETIIPAGESLNNQVTINITASVSSDYDVRRLADQLSKYWTNDFERISKSRGMI
jgi:hypothetical protein